MALVALKSKSLKSAKDRDELDHLLDLIALEADDSAVAQEAFYRKALLYRAKGPGIDMQKYRNILSMLVVKYPSGLFSGSALYNLARYFEGIGDQENALKHFELLRNFKGPNEWTSYAAFVPAMMLYVRGEPNDREEAERILLGYIQKDPFAQLYFSALFWLGRMSEESGNPEKAESYFSRIIREGPFTYYGIRARMHMRMGRAACHELWPDPATIQDLKESYDQGSSNSPQPVHSGYHDRIREALQRGFYGKLLTERKRLRKTFPDKRVEDLPLDELDRERLLTPLVLLMALREDTIAATGTPLTAQNRLDLACEIEQAGDWPLAIKLLTAAEEPVKIRSDFQNERATYLRPTPGSFMT